MPLSVPHDPEPSRPVVPRPGHGRRGPTLRRIALVGVDGGGDEERQLADVGPQASEVMAERVGLVVAVDEGVAVLAEEARVNVARAPDVLL